MEMLAMLRASGELEAMAGQLVIPPAMAQAGGGKLVR